MSKPTGEDYEKAMRMLLPAESGYGVATADDVIALAAELASQRPPHPMAGEVDAHRIEVLAEQLETCAKLTGYPDREKVMSDSANELRELVQLKRDGGR